LFPPGNKAAPLLHGSTQYPWTLASPVFLPEEALLRISAEEQSGERGKKTGFANVN
jgi:hypothetical protein